jgi:hypothetical protein
VEKGGHWSCRWRTSSGTVDQSYESPDLGLGPAEWSQVVAPYPATEAKDAVAWVVARLPGEGMRRIEHRDQIGRLVVPVWMVGVVHGNAEDLPGRRQGLAVEGIVDPAPVPSIAACFAGSTRTAKTASAGALMVMLALIVSLATACYLLSMALQMNTNVRRSPSLKFIVRHPEPVTD